MEKNCNTREFHKEYFDNNAREYKCTCNDIDAGEITHESNCNNLINDTLDNCKSWKESKDI